MSTNKGFSKKYSRRDILKGIGLGAGAAVLAACAPAPAAPTAAPAEQQPTEKPTEAAAAPTTAPAAAGKTKISYWTFWADRWGEFQQQIIDKYNQSQDKVEVEMLICAWDQLNTKLLPAIAAKTPPDFTIINRSDALTYAVQKGIIPITDYIKSSSRVKPTDWFDVAWTETVWQGENFALPFESGTYCAWLNGDSFKEAGVDITAPLTTWDDIDAIAQKLTVGDQTAGYKRLGFFPWNARTDILGWLSGGDWYDEKAQKITAVTPENIAAFEWIAKYVKDYGGQAIESFRQGLGGADSADDPSVKGQLAISFKGSWTLSVKVQYAPNLQLVVIPMPYRKGAKNATINQGSACVVPVGSPHPDLAFGLAEFMSIDGIAMWVPKAADMVSRKDQTSIFPEALPDTPEAHAWWKTYNEALAYAHYEPKIPVRPFWGSQLDAARDAIIQGAAKPEEALQKAQDETQKELDKALGKS
jgi:multiple sugar transport system substrate-binding protein